MYAHQITHHQWPFQEPKLKVPTMYKAYLRPKFQGIYPQTMAKHMVLTYLHFRILKFSLTPGKNIRPPRPGAPGVLPPVPLHRRSPGTPGTPGPTTAALRPPTRPTPRAAGKAGVRPTTTGRMRAGKKPRRHLERKRSMGLADGWSTHLQICS